MQYLVDTNVLLRAFWVPDPYDNKYQNKTELLKADEKLCLEARRSVAELIDNKEVLFYTSDILKEAKDVAIRKVEDNGFGLGEEKAQKIINEVEKSGIFQPLEKEIEKRIEQEAQQKVEQIAEMEKKTEAEKQALKEEIKKELKSEIEKKESLELEKVEKTLDIAKAKALEQEKTKAAGNIEKARQDALHVATAKTHGLTVLTFNKADFERHEDISVKRPHEVVLGLKPEEIRSIKEIENPRRPGYEQTRTYEVELVSGQKAELNVRGDFTSDKQRNDEIKNSGYLWTQDTINRLEQWKKGDDPVKVNVIDPKNNPNPDTDLNQSNAHTQKAEAAKISGQPKPEDREVTLEVNGKLYPFQFGDKVSNATIERLQNDRMFREQFIERYCREQKEAATQYQQPNQQQTPTLKQNV